MAEFASFANGDLDHPPTPSETPIASGRMKYASSPTCIARLSESESARFVFGIRFGLLGVVAEVGFKGLGYIGDAEGERGIGMGGGSNGTGALPFALMFTLIVLALRFGIPYAPAENRYTVFARVRFAEDALSTFMAIAEI